MFVYDSYSPFRKGAVANIVPREKSIVWGAIWEIDEHCLKELDRYEGYPHSYKRKIVKVKDDNENEYESWVYYREGEREGSPSEEYKKLFLMEQKSVGCPKIILKNLFHKLRN